MTDCACMITAVQCSKVRAIHFIIIIDPCERTMHPRPVVACSADDVRDIVLALTTKRIAAAIVSLVCATVVCSKHCLPDSVSSALGARHDRSTVTAHNESTERRVQSAARFVTLSLV